MECVSQIDGRAGAPDEPLDKLDLDAAVPGADTRRVEHGKRAQGINGEGRAQRRERGGAIPAL